LNTLMGQMGQLGHPDWEQTGHCPFHSRLPSSLEGEQTAVAPRNYKHGRYTKELTATRQWLREATHMLRDLKKRSR
jgi:hypothetical protein